MFLARVDLLNLVTRLGDVDLSFTPSGTSGFDDLSRHAVRIDIRGTTIAVASLADVIRSKEAAVEGSVGSDNRDSVNAAPGRAGRTPLMRT